MIEISCADPVLIVNPRLAELALRCDSYCIDGCFYNIDPDMKFRIASGESASTVLRIPYVKVIRKEHGYTDASLREYLESCYLIDSGILYKASFSGDPEVELSVDYDGSAECFSIYQWVPCGHCSVCKNRKMVSYIQRARFAVEESGSCGLTVTLKYNDEHLPKDGVLDRRDVQLFMKRLKSAVRRMYKFYVEMPFAVDYWRDAAAGIKVIYAGEYGKENKRPHWHLLIFGLPYFKTLFGDYNSTFNDFMRQKVIQYAWRFNSDRLSFLKYKVKYPQCYKTPKGYDPNSIGFVWIKEIGSDKAVSYALKYAFKDKSADESDSVFGTSCNLGLKFVKSHFSELLSSVDCKFKYKSVVDGKVCSVTLSSFYLSKLLPSYSRLVPSYVRKAFVDFVISGHFLIQSKDVLLPEIKKEISDRFFEITEKFPYLRFDFRDINGRSILHRITSYYIFDVEVDDDLPWLMPKFVSTADFLVDVFMTYESSYKILSESDIDYDEVCRQLYVRDKFYARFSSRTRSSILLKGVNFEYDMADLVAKSVL